MTPKKTLSVMTVDEFQKHMSSELTALEATPDDDRLASFKKSLAAYNAIETKDEHTRIPVELHKSDVVGDVTALVARIDELEKKIEALTPSKKEGEDDELSEEDKKKAEEAQKKADEDKAIEEKKLEEEKKKKEEENKKNDDASWEDDMGQEVLTPAQAVAAAKAKA